MKKNGRNRPLALVLAVALVTGLFPVSALAAEQDCNHVHDPAICGYIAKVEGAPCAFAHEHDDTCGWEADASPCSVEAAHIHDDTCGYVEAVAGTPCGHIHDEDCGGLTVDSGSTPGAQEEPPTTGGDAVPEDAGTITVTAFDALESGVKVQSLPLGAPGSDVTLPATLGASGFAAGGTEPERFTIEGVTWQPTGEQDSPAEYEDGRETPCIYYYRAVLPEGYALDESAALPEIEVRYGMASRGRTGDAGVTVGDFVVSGSNLEQGDTTDHKDFYLDNSVLYITTNKPMTIAMKQSAASTAAYRLAVADRVTANVTVNGVKIDRSITGGTAWDVNNGCALNLTLAEGSENSFTGGSESAGIQVQTGAAIVIGGSGKLTAAGGNAGAGIGGGSNGIGGTITIRGGEVHATGGPDGAGIGGGVRGSGGDVTVEGGEVHATGNQGGAGIGGGGEGDGGKITIKGGKVIAICPTIRGRAPGGAGIGGGGGPSPGSGGEITITGGEVHATGGGDTGLCGAGIGGGGGGVDSGGSGGMVKISGKGTKVTANSDSYSSGSDVGGGGSSNGTIGAGGSLSVTDGAELIFKNNDTNVTHPVYKDCTITDKDGNSQYYDITGSLSSYHSGDVAAFKQILTAHPTLKGVSGLDVNNPTSWARAGLVAWDKAATPYRIVSLDVNNKSLTGTLDVSGLSKLAYLNCAGNKLTALTGVSSLSKLKQLYCFDNQLETLDVTGTALNRMFCGNNPLTAFTNKDGKKLTITAGTGGTAVIINYEVSTNIAGLGAAPNTGYGFKEWTGLPAGAANTQITSIELNHDETVSAAFRLLNTDATLKSLSLSNVKLNPAFDPAVTSYTASVDHSVSSVIVTAEANDPKAQVTLGGNWISTSPEVILRLNVGKNTLLVWAKAEDGITGEIYTVIITRAAATSSGDGGDHRNYTVTTPPAKPDNPVLAVIELPVTVGDGAANGKADDGRTASAIADAAKKPQAKVGGIAVRYDAKTSLAYNGFSITIKRATLDRLVENKVKWLALNTGVADLTFDLKALTEIQRQTTGDITLTAARETGLTGDALAAVGSRPAYRLSVNYTGRDGKAATVDSFGAGKVTVGLAYAPAATEQAGSLCLVYSKDGKGAQWLYQSSYDKNSGNVIASTGHFSVYAVGCRPAPAFTDTAGHWAKADIDFVASRGLLTGTGKTTFSPNGAVTRGMFVTALYRLAGSPQVAGEGGAFTDVPANAYYADAVRWAANKGIVNGKVNDAEGGGEAPLGDTGEKSFSPHASITREQMAAIMQRYAEKLGYTLPIAREAEIFADEGQITSGKKDAVQAMQQAGVMNGIPQGTPSSADGGIYLENGHRFAPRDTATRAEAAAVLRRFTEVVIDRATAGGWGQNDAGKWLYYLDAKPVTGWKKVDSKWYYFDPAGLMQAGGWREIGGKWYYFYPDGVMAVNTKIDGCEIGPNGARKEEEE